MSRDGQIRNTERQRLPGVPWRTPPAPDRCTGQAQDAVTPRSGAEPTESTAAAGARAGPTEARGGSGVGGRDEERSEDVQQNPVTKGVQARGSTGGHSIASRTSAPLSLYLCVVMYVIALRVG